MHIINADIVIYPTLQGLIKKCAFSISQFHTQFFPSSSTFFNNAENVAIHGGNFNQYNGTVVNNTNIIMNAGIATIALSYEIFITLNFRVVPKHPVLTNCKIMFLPQHFKVPHYKLIIQHATPIHAKKYWVPYSTGLFRLQHLRCYGFMEQQEQEKLQSAIQ